MNDTAKGDRLHIILFGIENAGKSSLINALTHQKVAVVEEDQKIHLVDGFVKTGGLAILVTLIDKEALKVRLILSQ